MPPFFLRPNHPQPTTAGPAAHRARRPQQMPEADDRGLGQVCSGACGGVPPRVPPEHREAGGRATPLGDGQNPARCGVFLLGTVYNRTRRIPSLVPAAAEAATQVQAELETHGWRIEEVQRDKPNFLVSPELGEES